jgi:tol-pal system protein YbgF
MKTNMKQVCKVIGIAISIGIAMPSFAVPAPVYDVDTMQSDSSNDSSSDQDSASPSGPYPEDGFTDQSRAEAPPAMQQPDNSSLSLDQRVQRMEQQINNMQHTDLSIRVQSLQDEVQSLRGQLEQLSHQLELVQQKNINEDTVKGRGQARQKQVETPELAVSENATKALASAASKSSSTLNKPASKPAPPVNTVKSSGDQPNVAEEQQIYQTAYNFIKVKKYSDAITALQGMLKKYPSGQFASNAHYWLGELFGLMNKNDQAFNEFSIVLTNYPESPRVADAQLKVGLINASQSKWPEAKTALKKVINHYPGTASARLASEQLKQIGQAGH